MNKYVFRIMGILTLSALLTSCAPTENSSQEISKCPKIDLTLISSAPESAEYFEEAAKFVETETKSLVGLTESGVEACATQNNLGFRVGSRDGEFFALTMDYVPTRITVDVEKDIVVKIQVG